MLPLLLFSQGCYLKAHDKVNIVFCMSRHQIVRGVMLQYAVVSFLKEDIVLAY